LFLNFLFEVLIYFFPVIRGSLFGLLILGSLLLERKAIIQHKVSNKINYFYKSIILFFVAYFFWILDYTRLICFPDSIFQGHALWHILSALAGLMMYFYMDSEFHF